MLAVMMRDTGLVGFGGAGITGTATAGLQPVVSRFLFPAGTRRVGWAHTLAGVGRGTVALCCTSD